MAAGPKIKLKDKPGIGNKVEAHGGIPDYAKRIAEHIKGENPNWDDGRCIASARNTLKRWAAGGTVHEHGGGKVSAATQAKAAAALAEWKAKENASIETEPDLALAASALQEDFDEDAYRLALAAAREERGIEQEDLDLALADGDIEINEGQFMLAVQQERAARGIPLAGLTEKPLDLSADDGDSLNMAINFDPSKHPRDLKGRFREIVGGLKPGESVQLPDGIEVKRAKTTGGLTLRDRHGRQEKIDSVGAIADAALRESARNTSPASIGGATPYSDVDKVGGEDLYNDPDTASYTDGFSNADIGDVKSALQERGLTGRAAANGVTFQGGRVVRRNGSYRVVDSEGKDLSTKGFKDVAKALDDADVKSTTKKLDEIADADLKNVPAFQKGTPQKGDKPKTKAERGTSKDGDPGAVPAKADTSKRQEIPKDPDRFKVVQSKNGSGALEGQWTQHSSGDMEIEMPDNGPTARITQDEHGGRDKWGAYVFPDWTSNESESRTDFDSAEEARKWVESRIEAGDIKPGGDGDGEGGTTEAAIQQLNDELQDIVEIMETGDTGYMNDGDYFFDAWMDALDALERDMEDVEVIPGMGALVDGKPIGFISASGDKVGVLEGDKAREWIEEAMDEVRDAGEEGPDADRKLAALRAALRK